MRIILGALALVIAAPAAAQAAPAPDHNAGHAPHRQQGGAHQHQSGRSAHHDQKTDCPKDCCDRMKQQGQSDGRHDKRGEDPPGASADHSRHSH